MKCSESAKRTSSLGLGLSFIPLGLAAGLTNEKPWIGLFIGLNLAGVIVFIRYKRLNNS